MESVGEAETINQPMVPNHFSLTQRRKRINQQNLNFVVFCVPMRNTEKTSHDTCYLFFTHLLIMYPIIQSFARTQECNQNVLTLHGCSSIFYRTRVCN
jgi:hypothetical protein